jgi:N-acetylmuramoyl-L-alanine amidase
MATAVLAGCSTAKRTGETAGTGQATATEAEAAAAAAAAAASEKLAAIPFRCDSVGENSPWVRFLRIPEQVTNMPQFDVLCKSEYPAAVSINGQSVKQYRTGIFFATVPCTEGVNKITAGAVYPDGRTAVCEYAFIYEKCDMTRQPYPLWIERRSFEPSGDMELLPEEVVKVSFRGSKGQDAWVDIRSARKSIECIREDFDDYSIYRAEIPLRGLKTGVSHTLTVRLVPAAGAPVKETYKPDYARTITIRNAEDFPLVKVKNDYSRLVYNLGAPRLGGPIRQELGPGVVLKTSGKIGSNYRIRLSNTESGFISEDDVDVSAGNRAQPVYIVTSMTCRPSAGADVVTIPYLEPVPYEVYPDPARKQLVITMFGVESASTWVTHLKGCRIIDRLTWEQSTPETFRVYVNLNTENIWGYDIKPVGRSLVLSVRYTAGL